MQIEHITRFSEALRRLGAGEGRILLAVSGGPDSLALLLLAQEALPERIAAATVDHGLRPEAADEAAFVADVCARLGVAHTVLTPGQPIAGNLQSAARAARYALLEDAADAAGCVFIATAHHMDDQFETVLMRVARGSGIDGLSAIRARNGRIIRPMLGFAKAELEAICADAGVEPVRDPSNDDADFDRVAMRQFLASGAHPFDAARAALTAEALAEAGEALDWATQRLLAERMTVKDDAISLQVIDLPMEFQRRLLLAALRHLAPDLTPRGNTVTRDLRKLRAGQTVTIGNILCKGGNPWHLAPAPPRRTG